MTHDDGRFQDGGDERVDALAREGEPLADTLDAELSALLDGELAPPAAAALRARLVDEPALAARLARLGEVDGRIHQLAAELPDPARLERIRARLDARLAAEHAGSRRGPEALDRASDGATADAERGGVVLPLAPRTRWIGPLAAALAAGLAIYWLVGPTADRVTGAGTTPTPERVALESVPAPRAADRPLPRGGEDAVATVPEARPAPSDASPIAGAAALAIAPAADGPAPLDAAPVPDTSLAGSASPGADLADEVPIPFVDPVEAIVEEPLLATATDEEIAIAMQLDVLADLDVIENLELLELLDVVDPGPEAL